MGNRLLSFCTLCFAALPWNNAFADKGVDEHRQADAHADIRINDVAGWVHVVGWDRPEIQVSGSLGADVDRVDISGDALHVSVQVVSHAGHLWSSGNEAKLTIRLPAAATVTATLVSADFEVMDLAGELNLHTVSGKAAGELAGDAHVSAVSGDVDLRAPGAKSLSVRTVSGDVDLTGGMGETEVTSVSGTLRMALGSQSRVHFKSISGNITASLQMANGAQVDGESVSGDISLKLRGSVAADFALQSISGDIDSCFGPKPTEIRHAGTRLEFKQGGGPARVRIGTQSGDIKLCNEGTPR